ncbi:uncharacterized protein YacL [Pseudomonas sp. TE3786]
MFDQRKETKCVVIDKEEVSISSRLVARRRALYLETFSAPFFIAWAFIIGLLINNLESELLNAFFVKAFEEGVALASLLLMLVLSMLNLGCVFIFNPKPEGKVMKMLCSPYSAARAICLTTGANIIGLLTAMLVSEGPSAMTIQIATIPLSIALIWACFALFEIFSVDCVVPRNEMGRWAIAIGCLLLAMFCVGIYYTYTVILSGEFS